MLLADYDHRFRAFIDVDSDGQAEATTVLTDPVKGAPPLYEYGYVGLESTAEPLAVEGETVLFTTQWLHGPAFYLTHTWSRCDVAGENCIDIPGAVGMSYTFTALDVGKRIKANAVASDAFGSASGTVEAGRVVVANAPINSSPPQVAGSVGIGNTLTTSTGIWAGTGTIEYSYRWERCTPACGSCNALAGSTSTSYTITGADSAAALRSVVTGRIGIADAVATSACTAPVPVRVP